MKNPITSFNGWVISKIINHLTVKEGFLNEETCYTVSGIKTIVRDAFGYRYEIHVKTLSRLEGYIQDGQFDSKSDNLASDQSKTAKANVSSAK